MVPWFFVGVPIVAVGLAVQTQKDRLNLFFMGLFRDLGRYKAHQRRHAGNDMALMPFLLKQDDPLLGIDFDEEPDDVPTFTEEELWEFGQGALLDEDEEGKLLFSVYGRIYDVSAGSKFYGPGSRYHMFLGRDVTYALGSGCRTDECLEKTPQDLDDKQTQEALRWLSFFQLHDKYPYVGKLESNPLEEMMDAWVEDAVKKHEESGGGDVVMPKMF
eukprot:Nitzschia sp. Nitz4//scaffold328_size19456//18675//19322//NITZ4_008725-RA/size19456-processed-gene-0.26-mRNA-1//-1//CDS//3329547986//6145//frame0